MNLSLKFIDKIRGGKNTFLQVEDFCFKMSALMTNMGFHLIFYRDIRIFVALKRLQRKYRIADNCS